MPYTTRAILLLLCARQTPRSRSRVTGRGRHVCRARRQHTPRRWSVKSCTPGAPLIFGAPRCQSRSALCCERAVARTRAYVSAPNLRRGSVGPLLCRPEHSYASNPSMPTNPRVIRQEPLRAACLRHIGPYQHIGDTFARLDPLAEAGGLFDAPPQLIAIYHDDPATVPPADLRSDAGLLIGEHVAVPAGPHRGTRCRRPVRSFLPRRSVRHVAEHVGSAQGLPREWRRTTPRRGPRVRAVPQHPHDGSPRGAGHRCVRAGCVDQYGGESARRSVEAIDGMFRRTDGLRGGSRGRLPNAAGRSSVSAWRACW